MRAPAKMTLPGSVDIQRQYAPHPARMVKALVLLARLGKRTKNDPPPAAGKQEEAGRDDLDPTKEGQS